MLICHLIFQLQICYEYINVVIIIISTQKFDNYIFSQHRHVEYLTNFTNLITATVHVHTQKLYSKK